MYRVANIFKDSSEKYKMGCGSSYDASDGPRTVVVFGSTGFVGGSVAKRLLEEPFKYKVRCVTRRSSSDKARSLAELGAVIVSADLGESKSLEKALDGADVVFLTTHFWEEKNKDKEVIKGLNAVDAAINCGVKHIIFNGSENVKKAIGKECNHLDSKAAIEEYIREVDKITSGSGVNFTILRLPFWYENFQLVFKPHKLKHGVFAVPIPLEDSELDMISVDDVGGCVAAILNKPKMYYGKTLNICGDRLNMTQIISCFNKHMSNRKFEDSKIRVKDMEKFQFVGAKDLAAMFEFYQTTIIERDIKMTKRLNPDLMTFDKWVSKNKEAIDDILKDAQ